MTSEGVVVLLALLGAAVLPVSVLAALLLTFLCWNARRVMIILCTLPRDIRFIYYLVKQRFYLNKCSKKNLTAVQCLQKQVENHPNKACILFKDQVWTFLQVYDYSNKIAQVFHSAGYTKGDIVALFLESCPEVVCITIGLAKIGVVSALVNNNLRLDVLAHSIKCSKSKGIIFDYTLHNAVAEAMQLEDIKIDQYEFGSSSSSGNAKSLNNLLDLATSSPPDVEGPLFTDRFLYIFTSGTTGLPKPAIMSHSRYMYMASTVKIMGFVQSDDIIYCPLPLYHTAGIVLGFSQAFIQGSTVALRNKFSASEFWKDCIFYNCTVAQYIGDICKYLLSVPQKPEDKQHKIRRMVGNGIKPQIWKNFIERFQVPIMVEFYGSTEGNANMVNFIGKIGAVGILPVCIPRRKLPVGIIKVDEATCEPVRDKNGLCIMTDFDEPGMCIGIISESNPIQKFHGYLDKSSTEKKIIYNVFRHGDKAFLTGDLLQMDEYGYIFFKDRLGDTFRWKGENVATAEVEGILAKKLTGRDIAVYGVEIPGYEGRAGMATITDPEKDIDLKILAEDFDKLLPKYARPIFLRLAEEVDKTGTFKIKKVELQKENFDPSKVQDRLYVRDGNIFTPITPAKYSDITSGILRF